MTKTVTAERLREVLSYEPKTGDFRRLESPSNNTRIGQIAGCDDCYGYRIIRVDGRPYKAHRLAFLYMTGEFPRLDVDHANGDPSDNRWMNLREATDSQNLANSRRRRSGASGYKGVSWNKGVRKWEAQIKVSGRSIWLGVFLSPADAHAAYTLAATKHFGEFARTA